VLAQSPLPTNLAQGNNAPTAWEQADALMRALSGNSSGQDTMSVLEAAGLGIGAVGSSGDLLEYAAPGTNLGPASRFFADLGQSISRSSLFIGTGISAASALYSAGTGNYADATFTSIDLGVDLTLSRFGLYGGVAALAFDASGGSKNYIASATLSAMYNGLSTLRKVCALGF